MDNTILQKIATLITKRSRHEHYDKVVEYARVMKMYITGQHLESELRRFVRREDEEMFRQRVTLSQLITPAVCASLIKPHYRIPRVKPLVRKIDFEDAKEGDKRVDQVEAALKAYFGEFSLDGFMENVWVPLKETDPNAFIAITFDAFDNKKEKARPYPTIISSKEALDYEIKNGELQWLFAGHPDTYLQTYLKGGSVNQTYQKKQNAITYRYYTKDVIYEFTRVDNYPMQLNGGFTITEGLTEKDEKYYYRVGPEIYTVEEYKPASGTMTVARVGVTLDPTTRFETCISTIDKAMPYLRKSVHAVSEMDISRALHVFLQKIQYAPACPGKDAIVTCDQGKTPTGDICSVCKGEGKIIVTSGQDSIVLSLPKDPKEVYTLDNIAKYLEIPIDILKFLQELIEKIEAKAIKAVYGSEVYQSDSSVNTATEKLIDMQDVYDTLYPSAQRFSFLWSWQVRTIAGMLDFKGVIVEHQSPKDFGMRTLSQLSKELQLLTEAGAPSWLREAVTDEIAKMMYVDRPLELKRIGIQKQYNPFNGMTNDEINIAISNDMVTEYSRTLWAERTRIFMELELESGEKYFYDLKPKEIYDKVKEKVEQIILEKEGEKEPVLPPVTLPDGTEAGEEDTPPADDEKADNLGKLPLAIQQLALARDRAKSSGDEALASQIGAKMNELLAKIAA